MPFRSAGGEALRFGSRRWARKTMGDGEHHRTGLGMERASCASRHIPLRSLTGEVRWGLGAGTASFAAASTGGQGGGSAFRSAGQVSVEPYLRNDPCCSRKPSGRQNVDRDNGWHGWSRCFLWTLPAIAFTQTRSVNASLPAICQEAATLRTEQHLLYL